MGLYAITFTETRDRTLYVEADTVEHARTEAAAVVRDHYFEHGSGYNRWISGAERVSDYGTD